MLELEILQGAVCAIVYQNYENGYSVLRLRCQDNQTVTVVGTIPLPVVGEQLLVTGKWASHAPCYAKLTACVGGWAGELDPSLTPLYGMQVDYIKVYMPVGGYEIPTGE